MHEREQTAIEAVARRFSAKWEKSSDPYITIAGQRIALDIATLKRRAGQGNPAKLRLRFDKVATRLIERLQATIGETVPNGITVLVTITAPIRLPSKTAAALQDKIETLLGRALPSRDTKDTIHRNRVQIRLLRGKSQGAPKVIGFVHNSDSDPLLLLDMTCELLELLRAKDDRWPTRPVVDRWLVVMSAGGSSSLQVYRTIHSQLRMATGFEKILMVFGDGRVEMLRA